MERLPCHRGGSIYRLLTDYGLAVAVFVVAEE